MSISSRALEAAEAGDRAVDDRDQRQLAGQPVAERGLVVGGRGPGLALVVVVVVGRELLDAGAKNLRATLERRRRHRGAMRRRSSFELPGCRAVLVVLDRDAERGEFVAQTVGLGASPSRRARPLRACDERRRFASAAAGPAECVPSKRPSASTLPDSVCRCTSSADEIRRSRLTKTAPSELSDRSRSRGIAWTARRARPLADAQAR